MTRLLNPALLALALLFPVPAFAWGGGGHRIICGVAWDEMKPPARSQVEALLNVHTRETFAEERNWADVYRRSHLEDSPWHIVTPCVDKTPDLRVLLHALGDERQPLDAKTDHDDTCGMRWPRSSKEKGRVIAHPPSISTQKD